MLAHHLDIDAVALEDAELAALVATGVLRDGTAQTATRNGGRAGNRAGSRNGAGTARADVPETVAALQMAVRNQHLVCFTYHRSARALLPGRVFSEGPVWYFEGEEPDTGTLKKFVVERFEGPVTVDPSVRGRARSQGGEAHPCHWPSHEPIEVVVRNVAAGSLSKRLGVEEGTQLSRTVLEYYYKDDALGDPLITDEHIACFGWASQEEMHDIADMAIRINDFMSGLFAAIGIRLVDFKLEFGRVWENDFARIILADEISPDGCRLWDMASGEKLDKDRFRRDLGGEVEAYQEVARRLGLLPEGADSAVLDLETHRKKLR